MAGATFTLEELLEYLQERPNEGAREGWTEFRTTAEWCEVTGLWVERMRSLLREGLKKNAVERIRVEREAIDGRRARVTAFSFKLKKEDNQHGTQSAS